MTIKPKWDSKSAGEYERSLTLRDIKVEDDDDIQDYKKPWVGLTDDERDAIFELYHTRLGGWDHGGDEVMYDKHFEDAVAAIEAKLKEKNT